MKSRNDAQSECAGKAVRYRLKCVLLTAILCAVFFGAFSLNGFSGSFAGIGYDDHFKHYHEADQYAYLGDAFVHGRLWLDLPVPDALSSMENPYDFEARKTVAADGENPIFWDHAFYDGRYYCYFGAAPALLLYVPYQLVTGQWLNTSIAVCILGIGFVVSACLLVFRIARVFFLEQPSFFLVALSACMFVGGSNAMYLGFVSRFYSVPIMASILFTCLGLWFWLGAKSWKMPVNAKAANNSAGLSCWRLALGSVFMALNVGCRPQFMLGCFLAFPIFWDEIVHRRTLFSKNSSKATLCAILPFAAMLALQGWYNAARFGSPTDFGSQYNLTGFDMTGYAQKPITTLVVLFWYLLQPFHLEAYFPFVFRTSYLWPLDALRSNPVEAIGSIILILALVAYVVCAWVRAVRRERIKPWWRRYAIIAGTIIWLSLAWILASYVTDSITMGGSPQAFVRAIGIATVEPMFGGYFWLCPMSLLVFTLPQVKSVLKAHKMYHTCILMLVFAFVVLLVDARLVGANQRYFSDFAWYLMLVSILCLFAWSRRRSKARRVITLTVLAVMVSALVGLGSLFSQERYDSVASLNPELYEAVASLFSAPPDMLDDGASNDSIDAILKPQKNA